CTQYRGQCHRDDHARHVNRKRRGCASRSATDQPPLFAFKDGAIPVRRSAAPRVEAELEARAGARYGRQLTSGMLSRVRQWGPWMTTSPLSEKLFSITRVRRPE